MSVANLHPDELVDRERSDELSAAEAEALSRHRQDCAACAIERVLTDDFASEREAVPVDDEMLQRATEGAVVQLSKLPERSRRWWPRALLIAAAFLITAGALAAVVRSVRQSPGVTTASAPQTVAAPAPSEAPPTQIVSSATPELQLQASAEPAEPAAASNQSARPVPSASQLGPEALFAQANAARRAGHHEEAIRLYRKLQQKYPDSREASLSHATLGQLLLDTKDPSAAVSEFDHYLQNHPSGEVTEEVLASRARSLERLGKRADERAAWQALLAAFPRSAHAAHARQRLSELQ